MLKDRFFSTLLTLVLAGIFLLAYPVLHRESPFLQQHFKSYSTFGLLLNTAEAPPPTAVDSLRYSDSLAYAQDSSAHPVRPHPIVSQLVSLKDYSGDFALASFFDALLNGQEQIRIAYYGDSSIEGDLISATLRDSLQRRFGGAGIGFMPITSKTNTFRRTIRHFFSDNWHHCYIGRANTRKKQRGISGEYFLTYSEIDIDTIKGESSMQDSIVIIPPDQSYWVTYRPSRLYPRMSQISTARLFYGAPDTKDSLYTAGPAGQVRVETDQGRQTFPLQARYMVNELLLADTLTDVLRLQFESSPSLPIFGVSLESREGVILDNFSSRGNLGPGLKYLSQPMLQEFQQRLDYDLIILQFGLNVADPSLTDLSWYERKMIEVIRHYQESFPNTSILIIGPPDKAAKIGGKMSTDPSIPLINLALQQVAIETEVSFFSMYMAMGGAGSMVEWVETKRPRLANFDYTHFNFKGAAVAGNYVMQFLIKGLAQYESSFMTSSVSKEQVEVIQ